MVYTDICMVLLEMMLASNTMHREHAQTSGTTHQQITDTTSLFLSRHPSMLRKIGHSGISYRIFLDIIEDTCSPTISMTAPAILCNRQSLNHHLAVFRRRTATFRRRRNRQVKQSIIEMIHAYTNKTSTEECNRKIEMLVYETYEYHVNDFFEKMMTIGSYVYIYHEFAEFVKYFRSVIMPQTAHTANAVNSVDKETGMVSTNEEIGVVSTDEEIDLIGISGMTGMDSPDEEIETINMDKETDMASTNRMTDMISTNKEIDMASTNRMSGMVSTNKEIDVVSTDRMNNMISTNRMSGMVSTNKEIEVVSVDDEIEVIYTNNTTGITSTDIPANTTNTAKTAEIFNEMTLFYHLCSRIDFMTISYYYGTYWSTMCTDMDVLLTTELEEFCFSRVVHKFYALPEFVYMPGCYHWLRHRIAHVPQECMERKLLAIFVLSRTRTIFTLLFKMAHDTSADAHAERTMLCFFLREVLLLNILFLAGVDHHELVRYLFIARMAMVSHIVRTDMHGDGDSLSLYDTLFFVCFDVIGTGMLDSTSVGYEYVAGGHLLLDLVSNHGPMLVRQCKRSVSRLFSMRCVGLTEYKRLKRSIFAYIDRALTGSGRSTVKAAHLFALYELIRQTCTETD